MATYVSKKRIFLERKRRIYRRKLFLHRLSIFLISLIFCALIFLAWTFFNRIFSVKEVCVDMDTPLYSQEEIVEVSGLKEGSNIFFCHKDEIKSKIEKKLPFATVIDIKKKFPSKILINVGELKKFVTFRTDFGFVTTDSLFKVLEIIPSLGSNVPIVNGARIVDATPGDTLCLESLDQKTALVDLMNSLGKDIMHSIVEIDISNLDDIRIMYENRILVKLGSIGGIEKKKEIMQHILTEKIRSDEGGELDLSLFLDSGKVHFLPSEMQGK